MIFPLLFFGLIAGAAIAYGMHARHLAAAKAARGTAEVHLDAAHATLQAAVQSPAAQVLPQVQLAHAQVTAARDAALDAAVKAAQATQSARTAREHAYAVQELALSEALRDQATNFFKWFGGGDSTAKFLYGLAKDREAAAREELAKLDALGAIDLREIPRS